jgi:hypothetical protein
MLIYQWLNRAKERYYKIEVNNDGKNIILNYDWGSNNSNRGGKKSIFLCSQEEVTKTISKMMKRRKNRGYELITL